MVTFISQTSILLLLLFYATTFHKSMSNNLREVRCNEKDRQTLLIFKQGVILDPSNRLATWSSEKDCCAWKGVQCDNTTSRVTKLDLSGQFLLGEINLSLLELEFLNHLDLSFNYFNAISIPTIHNDVISNSSLHYLDLSLNDGLSMDNLHWLSQLSSLKYLNLGYINLQKVTNWPMLLTMLPALSELRLSDCGLNNTSPFLEHVNFTSLVTLDLSGNYFRSNFLYRLFNLSSDIFHLELQYIGLSGDFDLQWLSRLPSMKYLDLSGIDLHKETNWLLAMPHSLSNLYLRSCQLTNISPSVKYVNLTSLVTLDLFNNSFNSELPHWLFNLSNEISHLDLSWSSLHGEISSSLFNHQNLKYLDMSHNMFSGLIPSTLGNLTSLVSLSIGSNSFSGAVSETIFSKLYNLEDLDLSNSNVAFHFNPEWIPLFQLKSLLLENTNQGPKFPPWIYTQKSLDVLKISSSGISFVDKDRFRSLISGNYSELNMSNNSISEDISNTMLNSYCVQLGYNNFTGRLPNLSPKVIFADLSHNSFTGLIPHGWENLKHLIHINLWGNKLFGEVLEQLSNLKQLAIMNIGKNEFSGTIPINMSQSLQVLILRSNKFEGSIPPQIFNLSMLIHLDLAHNKLSGSIPQVVYNTTEMKTDTQSSHAVVHDDMIHFFTKGQDYEFNLNPQTQKGTIDLSANNLSGEIPVELFRLIEVQTLNLSYNHLTGTIPKTIGGMKNLESLDLSNNKLFGEIPQNMATLSFLSYLNLSCNNFTGQIPTGTQLQSFDASSYIGNPELCGAPLTKCSTKEKSPVNVGNEDGDSEKETLCLGMGVGFAIGFWGICGSLLLFKKWRHIYYRFLDRVSDQLYVKYILKFNTLFS